jgi:hypothetical protein
MYHETSYMAQRFAAAALFGQLEAIISEGLLTPKGATEMSPLEKSTRDLLVTALAAYGMPSRAELVRRM